MHALLRAAFAGAEVSARGWRRLRLILLNAVYTVVIGLAVVIGLGQLALPLLIGHPQHVERWLSQRLQREVTIGHLSGQWTRGGPRLILERVNVAADDSAAELDLPRAELSVDLHAAFRRDGHWSEFRVVGLDLRLDRDEDGSWHLHGIPKTSGEASMGALGALVLADVRLALNDPAHALNLDLRIPELRVSNRGRITRVQGRIGYADTPVPPVTLVADIDLGADAGQLYLTGDQLDLARMLSAQAPAGIRVMAGRADARLWARWQQSRIDDVRLILHAQDSMLAAAVPVELSTGLSVVPQTTLQSVQLAARWLSSAQGDWTLDVADARVTRNGIAYPPLRATLTRSGDAEPRLQAAFSGLPLEPVASVAGLSDTLPAPLRHWLYLGNPHGELAATVDFSSSEDYSVDVTLNAVGVQGVKKIPGIQRLDARLQGDAAGLLLSVPQQTVRLDYPHVFRQPLLMSRFVGDIIAWPDEDGWNVQTPSLQFTGEGYQGEAVGSVQLPHDEGSPLLDVSARVSQAEVIASKLFWPVNVMPPAAVRWLDDALLDGRVTGGRLVFRGELAHWPFADLSGRFEARAEIEDLRLAYLDDWPAGEQLSLVANFINDGMHVDLQGGKAMQLAIDSATASIPTFSHAVLDLKVASHGSGPAMLDFLRNTSIGHRYADYLSTLGIGGSGRIGFTLRVPLKHHEQLALDGKVDLVAADLDESAWDVHLGQATGAVNFREGGVRAPDLKVILDGHPAQLGLAIGSEVADPDHALEVRLSGLLPASSVFAGLPEIAPALQRLSGASDWRVAVDVGSAGGGHSASKRVRVESDLRGTAIDLPAPLGKPADAAWLFELSLELPYAGQVFSARLGEVVTAQGRLPAPGVPFAAQLQFGESDGKLTLPSHGVQISGKVAALDVGGWMELGAAVIDGNAGDDLFQGMRLDIGDLYLATHHFGAVALEVSSDAAGSRIGFGGAAIEGEISVPREDLARRGIAARLKHLHWPVSADDAAASPVSLTSIAPASVPPLHVWVGDLRFGNTRLGEVRLETFPSGDRMRIDQLVSKSASLDIQARGSWTGTAGHDQSQLVIDLNSPSIGRMLEAFGFAGVIDGGSAFAKLSAQWPGSPLAFDLAHVDGTLDIEVEKGRILDVDPGAGRLIGLLSLQEIPRRLALDFSDLFRSGLTFNAITGQFTLRDGSAYTDNLRITSPAADIAIRGRTGLRDRDYDQQMTVTPHAGVTLPVVGALAGGPVGAAAGLVVQGLLNKQINQATRSQYHVGGSWDKPDISLQARDHVHTPLPRIDVRKPAATGTPATDVVLPLPAWLEPLPEPDVLSPATPVPRP